MKDLARHYDNAVNRWEATEAELAALSVSESQAAAVLGRKGGRSKSEAKQNAARENGKKGGKPKKSCFRCGHDIDDVCHSDLPTLECNCSETPASIRNHQS